MTTNTTFGVVAATVAAYMPSIPVGSSGELLTDARITTLIGHASAELNGVLIRAGLSPGDIDDDATTVAYLQCQRIVCGLVIRDMVTGLTTGYAPAEANALAEWAEEMLAAIATSPTVLGVADATIGPRVTTTVSSRVITTDTRTFTEYTSATEPSRSKRVDW